MSEITDSYLASLEDRVNTVTAECAQLRAGQASHAMERRYWLVVLALFASFFGYTSLHTIPAEADRGAQAAMDKALGGAAKNKINYVLEVTERLEDAEDSVEEMLRTQLESLVFRFNDVALRNEVNGDHAYGGTTRANIGDAIRFLKFKLLREES